MIKPVYIFSGFLDSGKTQAIKSTLMDPRFNQGEKTLIVCFEQGDVIYDDKFLKLTNTEVIYLDSIKDFSIEKQKEIKKQYKYDRIFLELNGMEDDNILYNEIGLISSLEIAQTLTTIDASSFNMYMQNMRQFMYNHVINTEVVILNRADNVDKRYLRNNLKSINQRVEIIYEDANGNVSNKIDDDLFDLSKDLLVEDIDYGLWYMDALDNASKYDKKTIQIKAKYVSEIKEYSNALLMGRKAMVCCNNDITDIAIVCVGIEPNKIDKNKYYYMKGTAHAIRDPEGFENVVLYVKEYKEAEAPKEELVTFN